MSSVNKDFDAYFSNGSNIASVALAQALFTKTVFTLLLLVYKVEQDLGRQTCPTFKTMLFVTTAIGKIIFVG